MTAPAGDREEHPTFTGEQARQGRIILNTRRRRIIFFSGLVALILLPAAVALLW